MSPPTLCPLAPLPGVGPPFSHSTATGACTEHVCVTFTARRHRATAKLLAFLHPVSNPICTSPPACAFGPRELVCLAHTSARPNTLQPHTLDPHPSPHHPITPSTPSTPSTHHPITSPPVCRTHSGCSPGWLAAWLPGWLPACLPASLDRTGRSVARGHPHALHPHTVPTCPHTLHPHPSPITAPPHHRTTGRPVDHGQGAGPRRRRRSAAGENRNAVQCCRHARRQKTWARGPTERKWCRERVTASERERCGGEGIRPPSIEPDLRVPVPTQLHRG